MKLKFIIDEAKFAKKELFYHGTSSTFLPKIKKQGLVSNPKKRTWDDEKIKDSRFNHPSLISYGGIYLTRNFMTAIQAAGNTVDKFGGNRIIVTVEAQIRSMLDDEDKLNGYIAIAANDTLTKGEFLVTDYNIVDFWQELIKNNLEFAHDEVKTFKEQLKRWFPKLSSLVNDKKVKNLLVAYVQRQAAHGSTRRTYDYPDLVLPDKVLAEKQYVQAVNEISKNIKSYLTDTMPDFVSARNMKDISFHGENKIINIVELIDYMDNNKPTIIKNQYGNITDKLKSDYKQHIGIKVIYQ